VVLSRSAKARAFAWRRKGFALTTLKKG
jgi:hypothetical protein